MDLVSRLYLAAMHFNEDAERHKDRSSEVTVEPQQSEPKPSECSSHTHTHRGEAELSNFIDTSVVYSDLHVFQNM